MRLLGKLPNPDLARRLSQYLSKKGIQNQVEDGEVWILDEEKIELATKIYQEFVENPADPTFSEVFQRAIPRRKRWGNLTIGVIAVCAILFIWGMIEVVSTKQMLIVTPVYKALLYDFPAAIESQSPDFFQGLYGYIVDRIAHHKVVSYPLFTDIREGQVWRLFSPALLHGNLIHIFFNMIWVIYLGNQMEQKLGWLRYLVFMLIVGVISNTAQYLMGGPLFLGYSGVITGMFGFVWVRQHVAPWEGYLLNRATIIFLSAFILGMAALQTAFFILQVTGTYDIGAGIANTAHIAGALTGALFGRFKLMRVR